MSHIVSPYLLYGALLLGALGVALAMPRRGVNPQIVGALLAAIAGGVVIGGLAIAAGQARPSFYFYIFAFISLGASLRVITHPRPVYAALYFILTILSSAGLYVLLEAEFLTFALVIIYAGAILITYLFVIMLATEAPSEDRLEALKAYDAVGREPVFSTLAGFLLLAALTGLLSTGVAELDEDEFAQETRAVNAASVNDALRILPRKVKNELVRVGFPEDLRVVELHFSKLTDPTWKPGDTPWVEFALEHDKENAPAGLQTRAEWWQQTNIDLTKIPPGPEQTTRAKKLGTRPEAVALMQRMEGREPRKPTPLDAEIGYPELGLNEVSFKTDFPESLFVSNIEGVGVALLKTHPLALELAGVILLMAMLGAVVLARRQVDETPEREAALA